jgi:hypothetical protein
MYENSGTTLCVAAHCDVDTGAGASHNKTTGTLAMHEAVKCHKLRSRYGGAYMLRKFSFVHIWEKHVYNFGWNV